MYDCSTDGSNGDGDDGDGADGEVSSSGYSDDGSDGDGDNGSNGGCSLSLWRVVRGSKLMHLDHLIHCLFIT